MVNQFCTHQFSVVSLFNNQLQLQGNALMHKIFKILSQSPNLLLLRKFLFFSWQDFFLFLIYERKQTLETFIRICPLCPVYVTMRHYLHGSYICDLDGGKPSCIYKHYCVCIRKSGKQTLIKNQNKYFVGTSVSIS